MTIGRNKQTGIGNPVYLSTDKTVGLRNNLGVAQFTQDGGVTWHDILSSGSKFSKVIHVDPIDGDDITGNGQSGLPFQSIEAARDAAVSGDLIVLMPGVHTVTTTDSNGIAKDGVSYYSHEGVSISKATSGTLYDTTGFTTISSFVGRAKINTVGKTAVIQYDASVDDVTVFECKSAVSTGDICLTINHSTLDDKLVTRITGIYKSSANVAISQKGARSPIIFDCPEIISTPSTALEGNTGNGSGQWSGTIGLINGPLGIHTYVYSVKPLSLQITYVSSITIVTALANVNINAGYCGAFNLAGTGTDKSGVIINGTFQNVNITGDNYTVTGDNMNVLTVSGDSFVVGTVDQFDISNGNHILAQSVKTNTSVGCSVTGGKVDLKILDIWQRKITTSGGQLTIDSTGLSSTLDREILTISGTADVTVKNLIGGSGFYIQDKFYVKLSGGRLTVTGTIHRKATAFDYYSLIEWNGGELILDDATLLVDSADGIIISSTVANQNAIIKGGLFSNKTAYPITGGVPAKNSITGTATSITIPLSDGTNVDSFSGTGASITAAVTDLVTNATTGFAKPTSVNVAAVDNADGTCTIESTDQVNTPIFFLTSTPTGASVGLLRIGSFPILNPLSGVIVENINVK